MHKNGTPLRRFVYTGQLLLQFEFLTPLFDIVPGANIETSTLNERRKLESIILGPDESIVSLDVKFLYTYVPVKEAIEIALRSLYTSVTMPDFKIDIEITLEPSCDKFL